jgi:hypothetical protein
VVLTITASVRRRCGVGDAWVSECGEVDGEVA